MDQAPKIILSLLGLLVSVIFHEQMHARVAWWLGDPTGKNDNRLSWNPIHHIDPFMTILLPVVLYFGSGGRFVFGGAKPVMINPLNFRNPSLGMCLSAAAGPLSNFFLAALGFGAFIGLFHAIPSIIMVNGEITWNGFFFLTFIFTNVILGTFNILPLPGLDGSRILRHFLPTGLRAMLDALEPYAIFITMILVYLGASGVIVPIIDLVRRALTGAMGASGGDAALALFGR
ncbi:MAG TPA: site-2 protease family protein [Planctomycetota bacterium]|nr:site-2 protease family protein [Planctomycetota bacterium]